MKPTSSTSGRCCVPRPEPSIHTRGLDRKRGRPSGRTDYATDLPGLPDGLAFDDAGNLFVSCYEPSRILRIDPQGRVVCYAEDPTSHVFCHPTNIAFDGATLYTANLGRWHITKVATDTRATPVVTRVTAARSSR